MRPQRTALSHLSVTHMEASPLAHYGGRGELICRERTRHPDVI
jgi:hypothetical protein